MATANGATATAMKTSAATADPVATAAALAAVAVALEDLVAVLVAGCKHWKCKKYAIYLHE